MSLLISGLVGSFAFFAVVPRTKTWFSTLGGATLVVYLFHGFFVLSAEFAGFKGWAADHWPLSLILVTVLAPMLALFLAWKPVSSRLDLFVDPVGDVHSPSETRQRSGPQLGMTALNGTTSRHARPLTGRGVAAEVGGVPGRHLAGPRLGGAAAAAGPRAGRSAGARARGSAR